MANATDQQVQTFVNERFRPFAEAARRLRLQTEDNLASIEDVYNACVQGSPTWTDDRSDGPPHLLTPADVLAWNAFMFHLAKVLQGAPEAGSDEAIANNWAIIQKACMNPL